MLSKVQIGFIVNTDKDLCREGIAIPFRPFHTMGRFAKHCGMAIDTRSPLAEAILGWYDHNYGNRLRGVTLMGRLPLLLRGDIHLLLLAPHVEKTSAGEVRPSLTWSIDAGSEFSSSLEPLELAEIRDLLNLGWRCFSELAPHVCERTLSAEATRDLDISVNELTRPYGPSTGLSKWASLQAVEKSLKEFIRRQGGKPPHIHDVVMLHKIAGRYGLPDISSYSIPEGNILELAKCSPGVRYGEETVSLADAMGAYYSAIIICWTIAAKLRLGSGGLSWLSLANESPGSFVLKRLLDLGRVPNRIDLSKRLASTRTKNS